MNEALQKANYHHGNLRQSLLDHALLLIKQAGVAKLSLRNLAKSVGVSQTAPYRHFADKNALLSALASQGFDQLRQFIRQRYHGHENDPQSALVKVGMAYIEYAVEHPESYRLMFSQKAQLFDASEMANCANDNFEILIKIIRDGQQSAQFTDCPPEQIALTCWSLVHGFASLMIDGLVEWDAVPFDQLSEQILSLAITGILKPSV